MLSSVISAQQPDPRDVETDQPEKTTLPSGVNRIAGLEANSKIHYVCLIPFESLDTPSLGDSPSLIAQCTLKPSGKSSFELFANFGGATDLTFYPPWTPTSTHDLFPPRTEKVSLTMEFLGYTHVKPVRRQWEIPIQTSGQYRYNPPGGGSANLEEIAYYLRYLVALPTLRLTLDNCSADFLQRRCSTRSGKSHPVAPLLFDVGTGIGREEDDRTGGTPDPPASA